MGYRLISSMRCQFYLLFFVFVPSHSLPLSLRFPPSIRLRSPMIGCARKIAPTVVNQIRNLKISVFFSFLWRDYTRDPRPDRRHAQAHMYEFVNSPCRTEVCEIRRGAFFSSSSRCPPSCSCARNWVKRNEKKKKNDSQSFKTYKYYNIIAVEKLCSNNRKCVCDEVHDCNSRAMRTNIINDLTAHCVCAASTQNWIHSHTDAVHHHQPTEFHVERIAKKIVWHVCDKNWRREIWRRQISGMIDGQSAYVFDSPSPPYRLPRPTLHAGQMPIEIFARRQTGRAHNRRVVIYSA